MCCFERLNAVRTIFPVGPPAPSDADLISATRTGDADAYAQLTARHADSARRLARMLVPTDDVEALVTDAFAKIELVLRRGDGPTLALRPYLLTAVRRLAADRGQTASQPVAGPQDAAAARAFTSLAEPWRLVLWHTDVEGEDPADIAVLLGEPVDDVAPLIARAREGMRSAWLAMREPATDQECGWTRRALGAYARHVSFHDDTARVEQHLEGCADCTAILHELTETGSDLRTILAPLVLGAAAATYLDTTKGGGSPSGKTSRLAAGRTATVGAVAAAFGSLRSRVGGRVGGSVGHGAASAAGRIGEQLAKVKVLTAKRTAAVAIAGVAAVAVIAGGTFIVVQTSDGPVEASADAPGDVTLSEDATVGESPATDDPADPEASDIGDAASASSSANDSDNPSSSASSPSTDDPTFGPSDTPSQSPTRPGQPTQQPSQNPTAPGQPTQQPTRNPAADPADSTTDSDAHEYADAGTAADRSDHLGSQQQPGRHVLCHRRTRHRARVRSDRDTDRPVQRGQRLRTDDGRQPLHPDGGWRGNLSGDLESGKFPLPGERAHRTLQHAHVHGHPRQRLGRQPERQLHVGHHSPVVARSRP